MGTRVAGGFQAVGGLMEAVGGLAFGVATAETIAGAVAGGAILSQGLDTMQAGLRTAWTGKPQRTSFEVVTRNFGMSHKAATRIELAVDLAIPAGALTKGVMKFAASRATMFGKVEGGAKDTQRMDIKKTMQMIEEYMGEGMKITKPGVPGKSDLILTSADGTKQIRFDIKNSHGLEPHVNVETWKKRDLYPGDERMVIDENHHVYPKNNLSNESTLKFTK